MCVRVLECGWGKEVVKVQMYLLATFTNMKSQETGEAQTHTDRHSAAILSPRWASPPPACGRDFLHLEKGSFSTETVDSSSPFSLALGLIVPC